MPDIFCQLCGDNVYYTDVIETFGHSYSERVAESIYVCSACLEFVLRRQKDVASRKPSKPRAYCQFCGKDITDNVELGVLCSNDAPGRYSSILLCLQCYKVQQYRTGKRPYIAR